MTPKKPTTVTTIVQAKAQAKILKKNMKLQTVGASLNELAKLNGYKNWQALRAVLINDEPVKGQSLYTMNVNEQAFRAAGIITDISVQEMNVFVSWFDTNLSTKGIPFFEDNRRIVELLDNAWNVPTGILYAYIAYSGIQNMDRILEINKMVHLDFETFVSKYTVDFDIHDFTTSKDFFIALNEDAYKAFPDAMDAFRGK